jgi:hypothetical protein
MTSYFLGDVRESNLLLFLNIRQAESSVLLRNAMRGFVWGRVAAVVNSFTNAARLLGFPNTGTFRLDISPQYNSHGRRGQPSREQLIPHAARKYPTRRIHIRIKTFFRYIQSKISQYANSVNVPRTTGSTVVPNAFNSRMPK